MKDSEPWVLMVEDDPLFAKIFEHFWSKSFPSVKFKVSGTIQGMKDTLSNPEDLPRLVILDHNLPDGLGSEVTETLSVPNLCWSALGTSDLRRKPQGRKELELAVLELAEVAGFTLPFD